MILKENVFMKLYNQGTVVIIFQLKSWTKRSSSFTMLGITFYFQLNMARDKLIMIWRWKFRIKQKHKHIRDSNENLHDSNALDFIYYTQVMHSRLLTKNGFLVHKLVNNYSFLLSLVNTDVFWLAFIFSLRLCQQSSKK